MARSRKKQIDPTGQGSNRKHAANALKKRIDKIQQFALRKFRSIPRKRRQRADIINNLVFFEYDYSPEDQQQFETQLESVANQQLLESEDDPVIPFWYWSSEIEKPYRQGTIEETNLLNKLIDEAVVAGIVVEGVLLRELQIEQVLISEPYRSAVAKQIGSTVPSIKDLSTKTSSQVMGVINRGIQAGNSPKTIVNEIIARFDVSRSSAQRIANTEINWAYNKAKLDLGKLSSAELGIRTAVLHISALIPTTRATHAARHSLTFTFEAQQAWWLEGTNLINCHCTTQTVLVDRKGQPINDTFQNELKTEKKEFFDLDS